MGGGFTKDMKHVKNQAYTFWNDDFANDKTNNEQVLEVDRRFT